MKLSGRLSAYLKPVTKETGREVSIQYVPSLPVAGMRAAFQLHPTKILIHLVRDLDPGDQQTESSIAHEAAHGLLIYARGFCTAEPKRPLTDRESSALSIVASMLDDIVVNRHLVDHGFSPLQGRYLDVMKRETKSAHRGDDYYAQFSQDPSFKRLFKAFRYILAWASLEFLDPSPRQHRALRKFLKAFRKAYPDDHQEAARVKRIILTNDVFSPSGHRKALSQLLALWELDDLVDIRTH
ncbi:MAG: hypothetical protein ACE5NC_04130 [Anaerolineae bacterium]